MNPRIAKALINGMLIGGTLVALFPMLWMLSASLMRPGEAGALVVPAEPELELLELDPQPAISKAVTAIGPTNRSRLLCM